MFFSTTTTLLATFSALLLTTTTTTTAAPTSLSLSKRSFTGRATYFAVGLGACGQNNVASDYIVALNSPQYGSGSPGPECFKQILITYGGKSATATIMDQCPGCGYGDLDMSQGLFEHFADTSVGTFQMSWDYVGANAAPATSTTPTTTWQAPTTTYTPPTSTYTPPTTTAETQTSTAPTITSSSNSPSSAVTSSTKVSISSQPFFASAIPSAVPSSTGSNGETAETLSNIETLSQVLANLGQLVVVGSS